jgi:hypothetical protein
LVHDAGLVVGTPPERAHDPPLGAEP